MTWAGGHISTWTIPPGKRRILKTSSPPPRRPPARQPLFWRSFAYFCYRYFLKLGFLDGREGFLWHFMQGWWYRTLVDARQFEKQKKGSANTER